MQYLLLLFLVALIIQTSVAPPVAKKKVKANEVDGELEKPEEEAEGGWSSEVEYHRYLKEVVQALEKDPEFRAKLEKVPEDDIRTGKIAYELQFVNHNIRTKLDELKRKELERLRHLATQEYNLMNGLDMSHLKIAEHLDHSNAHTFEIDDLKKLIAKTTEDLADADKRRRQQFKEYEMQKKWEEEQAMKGYMGLKEEERKKYMEKIEEMKKKHQDHKPLHHPGSKPQLEEVWEKQDHMEDQEFDPKTFFYLHDLDGNGFWDQDEVKALFLKELSKLYAENAPEDDIYEKQEELERMREHVFNEADTNHDNLISYEEFLEQTKKSDFQRDEGWQGLDEQQIYSQQEYEAYQRHKEEEFQKNIRKMSPPPDTAHLPVQHEQFPSQYQQHEPQYQQQVHPSPQIHPSQQVHPSQQPDPEHMPPQYQGQLPQYQVPVPQQPQGQQQIQQQQIQNQVPRNIQGNVLSSSQHVVEDNHLPQQDLNPAKQQNNAVPIQNAIPNV